MSHFVIQPLSCTWWLGIVFSFAFIVFVIVLFNNYSCLSKISFLKFLSISFLITYLISNLFAIYNGWWNLQDNLPLHLCRVSFIISMIVLINKKQWMYEWTLFLSIPSGFHAILTPEMTKGVNEWFYFDYYFVHAGLILVPLFLTIIMKMRPRADAWWKTILRLQILVIVVMPLNFILDSNYIYLREKPLVSNPFLIGEWPIYILVLELLMVVHVFIIHKLVFKYS